MEKHLRCIVPMLVALALSGCNLQTKMLYYPSTDLPSKEALAAHNIRFWPAPANYRGFVTTLPEQGVKGTIIVFHGNAGTAVDRVFYANNLAPLGYRVVFAEYPAYGGRKGKPGEAVFVKDAHETLRLAFEQYGKPIFLLGESLGCGVAAAAAREAPIPIDGIILITPWDTLRSVAGEKFPWLPVRLFLTDKYDTVANLKLFRGNIAIAGAEQDEVIPLPHALALYEALQGPKKLWVLKGAGHNNWPEFVGPTWWQGLADFLTGDGREQGATKPLR